MEMQNELLKRKETLQRRSPRREVDQRTATDLLRQGKRKEIWDRYCGFLDLDINGFMDYQRSLLEEQLQRLSECELGFHIMKGQKPKTLEEFRAVAPITTYKDYAPYLLPKREDALPEKPFTWVHTSGRSGEYDYKWIPWPRRLFEKVGEAFLAAFLIAAAHEKGEVVLEEGMKFPYLLAPPPYISGVITESLLEQFAFTVLPALDQAVQMEFQQRIQTAFASAMNEGLDFFWGMTSILMKIGESFSKPGGSGGSALKMLLKPKAFLRIAKALVRSRLERRPLMPKDIWKVKGAICGGMDTTILKDKVAALWGVVPLEGYGCTEFGAIATQTWAHENLTFYPQMNFWEFIDEGDYRRLVADPSYMPKALMLNEVQPGEEYVLVGTNFHGGAMVRYILGDLVRIVGLEDPTVGIRLPQMTFSSRIDGLIDIGGFTRLTEKTIWKALEDSNVPYEDWTVRKEYRGEQPILHMYVELREESTEADAIADKVRENLRRLDEPYRDLEDITGLKPLCVTLLSKGTFQRYFEERQAAGADLAQLKPSHVNASGKVVENLLRMSSWRI